MTTVGARLREIREHHELSLNKVHMNARMSASYLARLERDEFLPGAHNLEKIAEALASLEPAIDAEQTFESLQQARTNQLIRRDLVARLSVLLSELEFEAGLEILRTALAQAGADAEEEISLARERHQAPAESCS